MNTDRSFYPLRALRQLRTLFSPSVALWPAVLSILLLAGPAQAEPMVRVQTVLGEFFIRLTPDASPITVSNFLGYVNRGDYNDSFFHRSVPGFIVQGGGFAWPVEQTGPVNVPALPPIVNEFNVTNARGTVAMARLGGIVDSATNQWFVNLVDNGANLDNQNEGFTVFGTIDPLGMQVVDAIAELARVNAGGAFGELPVVNFGGTTILRENVVLVSGAAEFDNIAAPFAAVLPSTRAVAVNVPATAFATLINASTNDAASCSVDLASNIPATFSYQQTNPTTNAPIGPMNPLLDLAAGASATLVFSLTPTAAINSQDIEFDFECGNADSPAGVITGVNTFQLAATTGGSADLIALAATIGNTGITDIPGVDGTGTFSVATINLGNTDTITVSADSGDANLPVEFFVCETDATGNCVSELTASLSLEIAANDSGTFSVFVRGEGNVPGDDPANNRAFVRFTDSTGRGVGGTSVALQTVN